MKTFNILFIHHKFSISASRMNIEDDDEITDIREQIFHNTVREHRVR